MNRDNIAVPNSSIKDVTEAVTHPDSTTAPAVPGAYAPSQVEKGAAKAKSSVRWPYAVAGLVLGVACAGGGLAFGAYSSWATGDTIAPGITIAGEPVGGLSQREAVDHLEARFGRLFIALNSDARPFNVSLAELGGKPSVDAVVHKAYQVGRDGSLVNNFLRVYGSRAAGERFALPVLWNKGALVAKLYTINHLYKQDPKDARLEITSRGVEVVPGETGRTLNVGETASQIQKKYFVGLQTMDLVSRSVEPTLTAAALAGKDVELTHYTTNFNSGLAGRTANIRVAAAAIEGAVLMPGETFSFNSKTGERTFGKGYRMAKIFERKPGEEESEVVDGLAGGVCQVSSTLFNAVRRLNEKTEGGLKVVERHHHSLPVTYVPTGLDATVAYPALDFRFRNKLSHPVYLRTAIHGSHLTISVWGRVPEGTAPQLASYDEKTAE